MELYLFFLLVATATAFSPGPGVVMTLSNALRGGWRETAGGILGIAAGALLVAVLSATGLGVLLMTSAAAFTVLKVIGAIYLCYLGIKLWRSPSLPIRVEGAERTVVRPGRRFVEAMMLQVTNPKVLLFFLSVFPQFIDDRSAYLERFLLLSLTYALVVMVVHTVYAGFAMRARHWLLSERGGRLVNRTAGGLLVFFGGVLATAHR
ncbi:LysE family translocator [Marinobacter sp. JSM 1782161]|uniref:LysE family translocator n=1 Tax=Marinobacter sp. JSM 1782161 TaxID=2685906 RepID=UPI001402CBB2|nr:LysE family translocator [Marinobacter sp. JSM 1782161]